MLRGAAPAGAAIGLNGSLQLGASKLSGIELSLLAAFIAAALILTLTPGADTAIVLNAAVTEGRHSAILASLGIALGCLLWALAVSIGLGITLHTDQRTYQLFQFAGASYLLVLGVRLLIRPRATLEALPASELGKQAQRAFRRGVLTNSLNPKVGLFYLTFLPQFVPAGPHAAAHTFVLACIHVALSALWFIVLIQATAPLRTLMSRSEVIKLLDRLTGLVFILFAAKLAAGSWEG